MKATAFRKGSSKRRVQNVWGEEVSPGRCPSLSGRWGQSKDDRWREWREPEKRIPKVSAHTHLLRGQIHMCRVTTGAEGSVVAREGNGEGPMRLTLDPAQVSVAGESRVCAASLRLT